MDAATLAPIAARRLTPDDVDAVIVVDVERDFCPPIDGVGGALAVSGGDDVAARITGWLAGTAATVVATADHHPPLLPGHFAEDGEAPNFSTTWPPHCVAGTRGVEWHPDLTLPEGTAVFRKGQQTAAYSGFEGIGEDGDELAGWLRSKDVETVAVVGIALDHCVVATALDAAANGFATTVVVDLTAAVDEATGRAALERLAAAGIELAEAAP